MSDKHTNYLKVGALELTTFGYAIKNNLIKKIFKCFGKGKFNSKEILNGALRNEINDQIEDFRRKLKDPNICACCGKRFPSQEMVVDHIFEFKDIVKEFFKDKGWKEFMMKSLYKEADGVLYRIQKVSLDDEFYPDSPRQIWQEFHKKTWCWNE